MMESQEYQANQVFRGRREIKEHQASQVFRGRREIKEHQANQAGQERTVKTVMMERTTIHQPLTSLPLTTYQ